MLAEKLGMTVAELLDRASSAELTEWAGYMKWMEFEQRMAQGV